ncbi:hypothetical protein BS78_01G114900 [Paspalum vaginatum]|nr:hypothetical protein BS78_01G114900 [Paspalum vaginatum]
MDYSLAVLKVFASQLADSTEAPSSEGSSAAQMLFNVRFQRAWVQGRLWRAGMYVMVIGAYVAAESKDNYPTIKMVDLSSQPDREAMWYMEVAEAYNFFYLPFSVGGPPS